MTHLMPKSKNVKKIGKYGKTNIRKLWNKISIFDQIYQKYPI